MTDQPSNLVDQHIEELNAATTKGDTGEMQILLKDMHYALTDPNLSEAARDLHEEVKEHNHTVKAEILGKAIIFINKMRSIFGRAAERVAKKAMDKGAEALEDAIDKGAAALEKEVGKAIDSIGK